MKITRLFVFFLIITAFGCSKDSDSSDVENGINHQPNLKALGTSAHDFLSADDYQSLSIEILYVTGAEPNPQTLTNLQSFINARLNKPGGVTITEREIPSPNTSPYDISEIADLESANRTLYNDSGKLALCILFVDGHATGDTSTSFTLGTAYRNTSCVIYENSIKNLATVNGVTQVALESTVLEHEFGHILGLVDLGSTMQTAHRDADHGKHCNNSSCLMYWQAENGGVMGQLNGNVAQLDANCLADLAANGGK